MDNNYKKDCYDANPYVKVHFSHGMRDSGATLQFLHYDKDLIIEYYRRGVASLRIEGNLYEIGEGDLVILNPDELHVSERKDSCYMEKIVIHISDGLLNMFGKDNAVFFKTIARKAKGRGNLIPAERVKELQLHSIINKCLEYAKAESDESDVLLSCKTVELLSIVAGLAKNAEDKSTDTATSNKTVNLVIDYINRHYQEELNLDIIADRFHFSKYYISHIFKEYVGISPMDYLIARRMYTVNNLIRSGASIKEASLTAGFNNYSNFFRLYKKHFKITPAQFKEGLKAEIK